MTDSTKILMKHNDLVNSKYETKLIHNKVFVYLLYKFQKCTDKDRLVVEISREELSKLVLKQNDRTIKGLNKILSDLRQKELFLVKNKQDGSRDYIVAGFIDKSSYNDKKDTFTITADADVHRLLHKYLEEGYTPINLVVWMNLKNTYAQRFYDILRAWTGTKEVINYELDYIKRILLIENKYKVYADFKKRVLIPAIAELNSTGYFEITFEEVRKGRSIESIDFHVKDLDKRQYFDKNVVKEIIQPNDKNLDESNLETKLLENIEFYIPDETVFTKGTLRSFKMDFAHIDFKDSYMKRAFDDAVMIVFDKDDVETIKATSYKFFKGTLDNKIVEYKKEREEDIKHQREMDMFW